MTPIFERNPQLSTPRPQSARTTTNSNLLQELEKYKYLKSKGALDLYYSESTPTNTNNAQLLAAASHKKSQTLQDEERTSTNSTQSSPLHPPSYKKKPQLNQSKFLLTKSMKPNSSHGHSPTPLLKEALSRYLTNTMVSPPPSSGSSNTSFFSKNVQYLKMKSPSIASTASTPLTPIEAVEIDSFSPVHGKGNLQQEVKSKFKNFAPPQNPLNNENARNSRRENSLTSPKIKESNKMLAIAKRVFRSNSVRVRKNNSQREVSPKLQKPLKQYETRIKKPTKSTQELKNEIETWRVLGKKMVQSYRELNERLQGMQTTKSETQKLILDLSDEIKNLKTNLESKKEDQKPSPRFRQEKNEALSLSKSSFRISQIQTEIEELRKESNNIKKTMEFLQDENDLLKKSALDMNKLQYDAEHYKSLAESGLKEASTLAEQIIFLRKDLDRSHSNFLKISRKQAPTEKKEETSLILNKSSLKSERSNKGESAKKVVRWRDEFEESLTCLQLLEQIKPNKKNC